MSATQGRYKKFNLLMEHSWVTYIISVYFYWLSSFSEEMMSPNQALLESCLETDRFTGSQRQVKIEWLIYCEQHGQMCLGTFRCLTKSLCVNRMNEKQFTLCE